MAGGDSTKEEVWFGQLIAMGKMLSVGALPEQKSETEVKDCCSFRLFSFRIIYEYKQQ